MELRSGRALLESVGVSQTWYEWRNSPISSLSDMGLVSVAAGVAGITIAAAVNWSLGMPPLPPLG